VNRTEFARRIAARQLTHTERAVAFLWYYAYSQEFDERTPSELAGDMHEEGFPRPNVTRLRDDLKKSRFVIRGSRKGAFQLDVRRRATLDEEYGEIVNLQTVEVSGDLIDPALVAKKRTYLERLVYQLNGSYEYGFYDSTAVLMRRLMESLLIEIYIHEKRVAEIRKGGTFLQLERLIAYVRSDGNLTLSRNVPKTMTDVKQLGDTAAHDRVYITQQRDIDDIKPRYRRLLQELLSLSGITP
jgi:hypothetical protein